MHSFTLLALMAAPVAFAGPIASSASALDELRQTNRISQVSVGRADKYQSMQKAYARYAVVVPPAIQVAASAPVAVPAAENIATTPTTASDTAVPVQSGSVTANPEQYDEAYLCPITVGHMNMNIDFDTGSSDLWVFSSDLPANMQGTHALYRHLYGTQNVGESWAISYGDGSTAAGTVWTDRVIVGGVTATTQAVEVATIVSTTFQTGLADGLLGLGFDNINQVKPTPVPQFMDNIASSLPEDIFTVSLKAGQAGDFDFGFIDPTKYTGEIAYSKSLLLSMLNLSLMTNLFYSTCK